MNSLKLKEYRKKLNLSQEELGDRLGLSKNTIYNYENGSTIPKSKLNILNNFFNSNETIIEYENSKLSKEDAIKAIETILRYTNELMKYESFALWMEAVRAEERNNVLQKLLKKRLENL